MPLAPAALEQDQRQPSLSRELQPVAVTVAETVAVAAGVKVALTVAAAMAASVVERESESERGSGRLIVSGGPVISDLAV